MYYDCYIDIKERYDEFIEFALSLSDYVTFRIARYDILSPESLKMKEEYRENHPADSAVPEESYGDYYDRMSYFIEYIKDAVVKTDSSFSYLGFHYGYLCETVVLDAKNPKVREFLLSADSVFSWKYPDFPEDMCYFRNGRYWFRSVTNKNLIFFNNITEAEAEKLKQLGVKIYRSE